MAVVLPVGSDSGLLRDCMEAVRAQALAPDLVVVDDSPRGELSHIPGATVLHSSGRGPYAARNVGWRATDAEVVLFLDVRSRPHPDWAGRLAACFDDPSVAVAGSDVRVAGGRTLGARAGQRHQFFELGKYQQRAFFRPYFPTCNLAVRRDDLEAVDGFREVRSGGDADLCWRILERPGRRLEAVEHVLMDWVPRDRVRGYLEQNYRYGRSNRALRQAWAPAGAPPAEPWPAPVVARRIVRKGAEVALAAATRDADAVLDRLREAARLAFQAGLRARPGDDAARLGPGAPAPPHILFLDQGRGSGGAALGHARAAEAARLGAQGQPVRAEFASVPPMTRALRLATRSLPRLGPADLWSLRYALARAWLARRLLAATVRRDRPAVVHMTTDQIALLLGRLRAQVAVVLSLDTLYARWNRMTHGIPAGESTPWHLRPIAFLERRALERAPLVLAWTQTVARDVQAAAPAARVRVLHPGLDLDAFRPSWDRGGGGPARVLFVGGRWAAKGGPALLRALGPRLGAGVEVDVVTTEDVARVTGVGVHRASPGSPELLALFARADLFCLPTTADACPWVVLEAMACGLPVVSTSVGSIPELVGGGGVVVPPGDPAALRSALFDLLDDPEQRDRMGRAGRSRVQAHYDARANGPVLIDLLLGVAAAGGAA